MKNEIFMQSCTKIGRAPNRKRVKVEEKADVRDIRTFLADQTAKVTGIDRLTDRSRHHLRTMAGA